MRNVVTLVWGSLRLAPTILSFPGLPHLQLWSVKLQVENTWGRGYVGYQMYASFVEQYIKVGCVLILGSLYTHCVITAEW